MKLIQRSKNNLGLKLNKLSLNAKKQNTDFSYQSKNDPTYCVINQLKTYSTSVNF